MIADVRVGADRGASRTAWLLGFALVLAAATLVLPWHVAQLLTGFTFAGPVEFANSVRVGLLADWSQGVAVPGVGGSALADATTFWRAFHIAKAVLALGVLVSSAGFVAVTWRARRSSVRRWQRWGLLLACGAGGGVVMVSWVVVIANLQGAVAPLSSALSFLTPTAGDAGYATAIGSLRESLTSGEPASAATEIVRDFSLYHAVVAVMLGATSLIVAWLTYRLVRTREWLASGVTVIVALVFVVLTVANVGTALHPIPALDSFLSGATG